MYTTFCVKENNKHLVYVNLWNTYLSLTFAHYVKFKSSDFNSLLYMKGSYKIQFIYILTLTNVVNIGMQH